MFCSLTFFFFVLFLPEKPKVTCEFQGQMGNQMFEIAAAVAYGLDHDCDPVFPEIGAAQNGKFNRKYFFQRLNTSSIRNTFTWFDAVQMGPYYAFATLPFKPGCNVRLHGYYQHEKYFAHRSEEIRKLFAPSSKTVKYIQKKYGSILTDETVAVHIRTFITDGREPAENWSYVLRALDEFSNDCRFIIFSDRPNWVKERFPQTKKKLFFVEGEPSYIDFYLMSFCRHQVVSPESTFSWWAAWLNKNPDKKVIVPDHWHGYRGADAFPEGWIRISL